MADVFTFGATGDGETDDTAALQHALNDGDGVLELHKGTYRITAPLVIDLTQKGYGGVRGLWGATRILMDAPGPALRVIGDHQGTASPQSFQPHTWEKERMPIFTGFEILGKHPEAEGIELRKTMQASIAHVGVRQCLHAIHLVERNRNVLISECHLYDNHGYGVYFDNCNMHQVNIIGCHISYNKRGGIKQVDGQVHNLQITGNDIEYNNHPGVDAEGEVTGGEIWLEGLDGNICEVAISGNTIQATVQPGGANIRIWGDETAVPKRARIITITGNVIGSQTRNIELRHAGRVVMTGNTIYNGVEWSLHAVHCDNLVLSGNNVSRGPMPGRPPANGVYLESCDASIITGNTMQYLHAGSAEAGAGITLRDCTDVAVSDCQILDPDFRGVEVTGCVRTRITNNTIADRREPAEMVHAIRVDAASSGSLVAGNILHGAAEKNAVVADTTGSVSGNLG